MREVHLSYTDWKAKVTTHFLYPQYLEFTTFYDLLASEGTIVWATTVSKDGGSDQIDFEANIQPTANQKILESTDSSTITQPISVGTLPLPVGAATESTLLTRLSDTTFTGKVGEVQTTPTANTLLARLKDVVTQLTTQVKVWMADGLGNAITSTLVGTKQAIDVNVVSSQSSTATAVDLGQSFGVSFDFTLPSAGSFNPVLLLKNPLGSGKRIRVTRINVGLTVANVSGIWRVFVDPTVSANGATITPVDLNVGGASNPATISQAFTTPTITANGSRIFSYESGQNMNSTEIIGDALFVLNPNHSMLLTGDPLSNNRNSVITVYWTEIP